MTDPDLPQYRIQPIALDFSGNVVALFNPPPTLFLRQTPGLLS